MGAVRSILYGFCLPNYLNSNNEGMKAHGEESSKVCSANLLFSLSTRQLTPDVRHVLLWVQNLLDRPNHFGRVPIVLDKSNSFWTGPIHFGQVQIIKNKN